MDIRVGKDEKDWLHQAWTWVHEEIEDGERVFVPAGGTPQSLYRQWCEEPSPKLKTLRFVQIDEILTGEKKGYFRQFFETELGPFLSQMEWIEAADQLADVAILGVGINGHVAFHEPQLPKSFASGCVRLSEETLSYLDLEDPTWGVTYGVGAFLKARKILVLAKGEKKKPVLERALRKEPLPITWILEHPRVTLLTDFPLGN